MSIDISKDLGGRWYAARKNLLLIQDAIKSDYRAILRHFTKTIDDFSLHVDGHYTDVLEKIPFNDYTFKIITIEHDFYRYGDIYRAKERQILKSLGYYLLCSDVSDQGLSFEDWWIHPSFFSASQFSALTALDLRGKDHQKIIKTIQALIGETLIN